MIQQLYTLEREGLTMDAKTRHQHRQTHHRDWLERFRKWCDDQLAHVLPKSPLGKALAYTLNHWDGLTRHLEHPDIPIDNNAAERAMRPIAVGRKNWLFAGSVRAGQSAATIYSLIQSAKNHDLNVNEYLAYLLRTIPNTEMADMNQLLPEQYKARLENA